MSLEQEAGALNGAMVGLHPPSSVRFKSAEMREFSLGHRSDVLYQGTTLVGP